jgi:hypothetical protein
MERKSQKTLNDHTKYIRQYMGLYKLIQTLKL